MALLIPTVFTVFFHTFPVSPVILVYIFTTALFAPTPQPIFAAEPFAKLTLVFPFMAFGALFHSCLLIYVSLLIPHRQPPPGHPDSLILFAGLLASCLPT